MCLSVHVCCMVKWGLESSLFCLFTLNGNGKTLIIIIKTLWDNSKLHNNYYAKCFIVMIAFNPHNHSMSQVLLYTHFIIFCNFYLFIFLSTLCFLCYLQTTLSTTFSSCGEWGLLSSCSVQGGISYCRTQALGCMGFSKLWLMGSVVVPGTQALLPCGMWNLPTPQIEPMCSALADRFSTTGEVLYTHFIKVNSSQETVECYRVSTLQSKDFIQVVWPY